MVTKESTRVDREGKSPVYGLIQTNTRSSIGARSAGTVLIDEGGAVIGLVTSRADGDRTNAVPPTTTGASAGRDDAEKSSWTTATGPWA